MVEEIFDTKSLQRCKGKAAKKWSKYNFIFNTELSHQMKNSCEIEENSEK